MADKIDIDTRKNFKKLRTNQPENRQLLKTASLNSTFTAVLKKKNVLRLVHFSKILLPKVTVNVWVYPPTTSRAFYVI